MKAPLLVSLFALALPVGLFAQAAQDTDPFKVNYAANLNQGDSAINFVNTGAFNHSNICVNIYTFSPDEEMQTCCAATLSPNSIWSAALLGPLPNGTRGLLSNTASGINYVQQFHSAVIKVLVTDPGVGCNAGNSYTGGNLVPGLLAWGTHSHQTNTSTVAITETFFGDATLSAGELSFLTSTCNFFETRLSGAGICPGAQLGGLNQTSSLTPKLGSAQKAD